jgi:hypothetical protein
MSYHTIAYNISSDTAAGVNTDATAVTDTEVSVRNSHFIFTERYRLLSAAFIAAAALRGRFQVPKWNAIGEFAIFNANRSLQTPSNPQWDLWLTAPPEIPQNEEFQVQLSNDGAGGAIENCVLNIAPDDWNQNIPKGELTLCIRASATITPTINAWSGPNAITLSQSLRGGVYAVVGTVVQGTDAVAWRWIFPRNKMYHGRRLRPGGLVQTARGDTLSNQVDPWVFGWGVKGVFHTFELPQIELLGTVAAAITYQIFIWVVRLGEDVSILNQYAS